MTRLFPGTSNGATRSSVVQFMEVHSGLSARIAATAGFEALWASGLAISSLIGLRDANEASWTQVLSIIEWIADATERPVLVDGDSGHGNFNNARRFAQKVSNRGAAGVCFEDKAYPKTNSFIGDAQPLAEVAEFCGRITASREAVSDASFAIVARVEALVSGRSLAEALDRAHAYVAAGADGVFIHSKRDTPDEVLSFARQWCNAAPLIVAPTTYPQVTCAELADAGIRGAIWANHNLRASVAAMAEVCRDIRGRNQLPGHASPQLTPLSELFRLLDYDELARAESRHLPPGAAA